VPDDIAVRRTKLEAEVLRRVRHPATLVAIPAELAQRATVTFPPLPIGEPVLW